ncbi:fidgetin-like protein 1 [Hydractinia symbiolongicarpus]|uniref:fidgetin-like protein 1 n=1 Tax=Hydractinia symbiolongicarpus TaxID=13093 RepID=UPI00254CA201|nr:fidgetin-like protein 1 [Hydractinia symbiolongicarpus]
MANQDTDKYLKQFWQTKKFALQSENMSSRDKADTLRSLMFFLHSQLASGKITESTYCYLHKQLSEEYSLTVDSMDKNKGLNNYNELMTELAKDKQNDSHSWKSELLFTNDKQSACIKRLLERRTKKVETKYMEIKFSQLGKNNLQANKTHLSNADKLEEKKDMRSTAIVQHLSSEASRKHAPMFGKRKFVNTTSTTDKRRIDSIEKENKLAWSSKALSTTKTFKYPSERNCKIDDTTSEKVLHQSSLQPTTDHCLQQKPQQPFLTAREQLVVEQKKKGKCINSGVRESISTASYGGAKKSLGTRRGVNTKFVPPVHQEKDDTNLYNRSTKDSSLDPKYENCEWMKNVDPKMVTLIENEIMEHGPNVSWEDIAGLEFAKKTIQEIVIWPMLRPDIFTGLRGPPKGLLLFGPPGTGKTLIGKCIASHSNATFFSISASSLTSKWVGEGEKMVRALFAVARCQQPAVIFIDEIDSLLTQRSDSEHESSRRIKTEFLVQLDGATSSADDRILVVGATNRPQELDEAARRRLVKRLYIPLPEENARKQIIGNLMAFQSNQLSENDVELVTKSTVGFSGADMANLCREAALGPIRSINDIRNINADDVRPIVLKDFEAALKFVRPSVSQNDLKVYVDWNLQYGSGGGEP